MRGVITAIRPSWVELKAEAGVPYVASLVDCDLPLSVGLGIEFEVKIGASNRVDDKEKRRWLHAKNVRPTPL
jgi:hypothetical protein